MNALLRYAVMKSFREHLLGAFLLAPLVMACAPMLGVAALAGWKGESIYPLHVPAASPEETAAIFGQVTVVFSAFAAGAAAFWVFRNEIASRAVHFFILAHHPRAVCAASTTYGFIGGMLAYSIARTAITILTASPQPRAAREVMMVMASVLLGSALGSLLVAISTEAAILVPIYVGVVGASIALLQSGSLIRMAVPVFLAVALMQAATIVLRRRCAS